MGSPHLSGKVAIVTGGAAGIGRAIAVRYGREGARVVIADVNQGGAEAVAAEILGAGGEALAVGCDVSSAEQCDRLFEATAQAFNGLDILVNNAALVSTERHFLEADDAWWSAIIGVNLTGVYNCCVRAARLFAAQRSGVIIALSSGGATRSHRGNAAYDAAKGGIEALVRAMALDLGPYGVRCCGLVPGSIDTRGLDPATKALRGETVPLGRVGEANDVAGPAVFLAGDDAAYVTGSMLLCDGGLLAQQRSPQVDIFPLSRYPGLAR